MGWLSGWDKRVKITVDSGDVDNTLSNFPVLVYLSTSSGYNSDDVSFVFDELTSDANRKKIAVTLSDETTECYVEIEKWDDANEKAWLWVKAPSLNPSTDTDFYLYYDKDHADNTAYVGDAGSLVAQNVWDPSFKMVQHLHQSPVSDFTRDAGNPIYGGVGFPPPYSPYSIVKSGSTYHLYYVGGGTSTNGEIYHATTADLEGAWTEDPDNPVLVNGGTGEWDDLGSMSGSILHDVTTGEPLQVDGYYWLFYDGWQSGGKYKIGIARNTSLSGNWTKYAAVSPCLEEGASGEWDDGGVGFGNALDVFKDGDTYYMFFNGYDGTYFRIGYATSTNLVDWVKYENNPVIDHGTGWENNHVTGCTIWKTGSTYVMIYTGSEAGVKERMGRATATSLDSWTKDTRNPIAEPAGGWEYSISDFILFRDAAKDYLYYEGENQPGTVYGMGRMWCNDITTAFDRIILDSTSNRNDGTPQGSMTAGDQVSGKVNGALDFDGSDDYINIPVFTNTHSKGTVELWFNAGTLDSWDELFSQGSDGTDPYVFTSVHTNGATKKYYFYIYGGNNFYGNTTIATATDYYAVVLSTGTAYQMYVNNVLQSLTFGSGSNNGDWFDSVADQTKNGIACINRGTPSDFFDGVIDEVRVSDVDRSSAWIKATYETQRDHLLDFGSEETPPVPAPPPSDPRRQTKTWVDTYWTDANVTKDDGSEATIVSMYAFPDYPLKMEFRATTNAVDGLILIGEPNSTPLLGHDHLTAGPYGYEEHVPIFLATIDKTGVTGTKLKWKMEVELRRICETYPAGSQRNLERRGDADQRLGATTIYMTKYVLNYRRDTT